MARSIVSVFFPSPKKSGGHDYARLARAFAASIQANDPTPLDLRVITAETAPASIKQSLSDNTAKFHEWVRAIDEADEGDEILLMDCDMLVLQSTEPAWLDDFDIAYTPRPRRSKYPLNGGVVFVRVNEQSKRFMREWRVFNDRMMIDRQLHAPWRNKYGGINQASFGYMLERADTTYLDVMALPGGCIEWNCEDQTWHKFDPAVTRILHLKSNLRKACLGTSRSVGRYGRLARLFRKYEQLARDTGVTLDGQGKEEKAQAVG